VYGWLPVAWVVVSHGILVGAVSRAFMGLGLVSGLVPLLVLLLLVCLFVGAGAGWVGAGAGLLLSLGLVFVSLVVPFLF
jgi:hypothetical protein